ncbi:MAG: O-methyltransferase [Halobacteriales archaeon]
MDQPKGELVADDVTEYAEALGPPADDVIREMERHARQTGFPVVGRAAAGWLAQTARMTDATRVFELGSGFGYSAYWFARELPPDGEVVLTERDNDLLELARDNLERGGLDGRATYEQGDALETMRQDRRQNDVVFVDVDKESYPDALELALDRLAPGGAVVADNVMTAGDTDAGDVVNYPALHALQTDDADFEDVEMPASAEPGTRGVHTYLERLRRDERLQTTLLPLGDGLAVSVLKR